MESVTFTSADIDQVLKEFVDSFSNPNRVNADVITDSMRQAVYENFATESGGGVAWRPLAPQTVEEREFLGFPGTNPILFRSGDLFESATNPNDPDHIEEITADADGMSFSVGTRDPRAGRLDAVRPFLIMDDPQIDRHGNAIEAYLEALF